MRSSPDPTSRPPIDLSRVTERTRRQVYDAVAAVFFDREDTSRTFAPEEGGLAIYHFAGRWFAVWLDLDAPADLPEDRRRQVLRVRMPERGEMTPGGYGLVFDEA
jgi:hypothetical protein